MTNPATIEKIALWGYYCRRCGHRWVPRGLGGATHAKGQPKRERDDPGPKPVEPAERPLVCPLCKSPYWHREKDEQRGEKG